MNIRIYCLTDRPGRGCGARAISNTPGTKGSIRCARPSRWAAIGLACAALASATPAAAGPAHTNTLYVVFWVDDFGAGGELDRDLIAWYHDHAGPISYLLQKDDTRFYALRRLLARYDFGRDYLGHHFHAFRWPGSRLRLWLNNHVYLRHLAFREWVGTRLGCDLWRARNILSALSLFFIAGIVLWRRSRRRGAAALAATALAAGLAFLGLRQSHLKIADWRHWSYELNNADWCREFLRNAQRDYRAHGMDFPPVTRHGWNLPPAGLMDFYMTELGVLADASPISGAWTNDYLETAFGYSGRTLAWPDTVHPYWAMRSADWNIPWDGRDESERGPLMLPLTFPNAQLFKVDEPVRQRIADLPDGALLSTYLHPGDKADTLKALIEYLNDNHPNVKYVRPDDYVERYLRRDPRPVLITDEPAAYWACDVAGQLRKIRASPAVDVEPTGRTPYRSTFTVRVETESPLPLLEAVVPGAASVLWDQETLPILDGHRVRQSHVPPGIHSLELMY